MPKNIVRSESYVRIAHSKMSRSLFAQLKLGILSLKGGGPRVYSG